MGICLQLSLLLQGTFVDIQLEISNSLDFREKTELKNLEDKIADLDAEQLNFHHDKRKLEIAREEYLYTIDSIEKGRPSQKYYPFQVVDQRFGPLTAR